MSINPFTKLPYSSSTPNVLPVLSLMGNVRGVVNYDSAANTTMFVNGDAAMNGVCHIKQLRIGGPESVLSDERCKKNFWHIENPFYALDRIQGYTFDYLHDNSSSMGFKAQEVEQLFPFLVEQHNDTKYVAYQPLIACAWEAVKLLNNKVDQLQNQLTELHTTKKLAKTTKTTKTTKTAETTNTTKTAETAETAETAKTAETAETAETTKTNHSRQAMQAMQAIQAITSTCQSGRLGRFGGSGRSGRFSRYGEFAETKHVCPSRPPLPRLAFLAKAHRGKLLFRTALQSKLD